MYRRIEMKSKSITAFLLGGVLAVYAGRAAAQHSHDHSADSTNQNQTKSDTASPGMKGQGMTGGAMTGMMGQMMTHHKTMSGLMTKLMASMKAIEDEKDPAALKAKLAEHRALLGQMHTQMMQQGGRMKDMTGMMMKNCTMMGDNTKPSTQ
jgi:hypothetical protein